MFRAVHLRFDFRPLCVHCVQVQRECVYFNYHDPHTIRHIDNTLHCSTAAYPVDAAAAAAAADDDDDNDDAGSGGLGALLLTLAFRCGA